MAASTHPSCWLITNLRAQNNNIIYLIGIKVSPINWWVLFIWLHSIVHSPTVYRTPWDMPPTLAQCLHTYSRKRNFFSSFSTSDKIYGRKRIEHLNSNVRLYCTCKRWHSFMRECLLQFNPVVYICTEEYTHIHREFEKQTTRLYVLFEATMNFIFSPNKIIFLEKTFVCVCVLCVVMYSHNEQE